MNDNRLDDKVDQSITFTDHFELAVLSARALVQFFLLRNRLERRKPRQLAFA